MLCTPPSPHPDPRSHEIRFRCCAEVTAHCGALALTIVAGIHMGILHSVLAQLNPDDSLHFLK